MLFKDHADALNFHQVLHRFCQMAKTSLWPTVAQRQGGEIRKTNGNGMLRACAVVKEIACELRQKSGVKSTLLEANSIHLIESNQCPI